MSRDEQKSGLTFTHRMMMQEALEAGRTRADALGLLEELLNRGIVETRELEARRGRVERQLHEAVDPATRLQLHPDKDKRALTDLPDIDCLNLLPVCKARCCKLQFELSREDLQEGGFEWELGAPYLLRRGDDGYCTQNCGQTRHCTQWDSRPASCRQFDCRQDRRIWLDFERRIPTGGPAMLGRDGGYRTDHGHDL
jgi:hypothetical protein